jgi:DOPA 4,5-dioxygenase
VQKCRTSLQACQGAQPYDRENHAIRREFGLSRPHLLRSDKDARAVAEQVCAAIEEKFPVEIDGFRDTPVGPHPIANVLVVFKPDQFEQVVPYLMLNRAGLDVLVHPLTEDAVEDHSSFAIWLGNPVELKLHTLPRGRGGRLPSGISA